MSLESDTESIDMDTIETNPDLSNEGLLIIFLIIN